MLSDGIVNYLIDNVVKVCNFQNIPLQEKQISNRKIKLVFQSGSIKHSAEFVTKEICEVIFSNFIGDYKEKIDFDTFKEYFYSLMENITNCSSDEFEKEILDMCYRIKQSQLF